MFKKKNPINIQVNPRQSNKDQRVYGIQAKLDSMIQNGSRLKVVRQKQNKIKHYAQIHQHQQTKDRTYLPSHQLKITDTPFAKQVKTTAPLRKIEEKKPASFETQLKGLIKIIYQKQKEIQKLKETIKFASIRAAHSIDESSLQSNQLSHQADSSIDELGLNVEDIKQTTKRILELEAKQEQLHEVIDFLVKKQEETAKQIKQLTAQNKSLEENQKKELKKNENLINQFEKITKRIEKEENLKLQRQTQLKQKDQQILRLNADILKVIQQSQVQERELSQKIFALELNLKQLSEQQSEEQIQEKHANERQLLQAIEEVKHRFQEQIEGLEYEISNLKIIEEEGKQMIREQDAMIQEIQGRVKKEKEEREKMKEFWEKERSKFSQELRQKQSEISNLDLKVLELSEKVKYLKLENSQLNERLSATSLAPALTCTISTHSEINRQLELSQSTISQYKKLLEQLKNDMQQQEDAHQQEVVRLEFQVKDLERKLAKNEEEKQIFKENLLKRVKKVEDQKIKEKAQWQVKSKALNEQIQNFRCKNEEDMKRFKEAKVQNEEKVSKLTTQNQKLQKSFSKVQETNESLEYKLSALSQQSQTLQEQKSSLQQTILTLTQQISQQQSTITNLQTQIAQCKQQISLLQIITPKTSNLLSLRTINNLSCIDLVDSSFECKLQQLTTTKRVTFEQRKQESQEQSEKQKEKQTQGQQVVVDGPLSEQNASYLRYQENLLQELERQCNEPTELFLGQGEDRTKLVELSEVRQSLKMTKEVNFQLFEEINRQEKIINEFKTVLRMFIQTNKTNVRAVVGLDKLEGLLLLK